MDLFRICLWFFGVVKITCCHIISETLLNPFFLERSLLAKQSSWMLDECHLCAPGIKIKAVQSRATSAQTAKPLGKDSTEKLSVSVPETNNSSRKIAPQPPFFFCRCELLVSGREC